MLSDLAQKWTWKYTNETALRRFDSIYYEDNVIYGLDDN